MINNSIEIPSSMLSFDIEDIVIYVVSCMHNRVYILYQFLKLLNFYINYNYSSFIYDAAFKSYRKTIKKVG